MKRSRSNRARVILIAAVLLVCGSVSFGRVSVKTLPELVKMSPVIAYGRVVPNDAARTTNSSLVTFDPTQTLRGSSAVIGKEIALCRSPPPMIDYPDISKWAGREVILFLSPRNGACFELSHSYVAVIEVKDGIAQTGRIEKEPDSQPFDLLLKKIRRLVARLEQVSATEK